MKQENKQTFSFVYFVNLGENKIGQIFINEESDPYVESSKFCAKYQLPTLVFTILGDELKQQIEKQKHLQNKIQSQMHHQKQNRKILSPKWQYSDHQTFQTELRQDPLYQKQPQKESQQNKNYPSNPLQSINQNVFDSLYHNHKEVQMKKQLQRQRSYELIPFKPKINQLSNKIVEQKKKIQAPRYQCKQKSVELKKDSCRSIKIAHTIYSSTQKQRGLKSKNKESKKYPKFITNSSSKGNIVKYNIDKKLMETCTFRPKITARLL